jgi:acetyl esterase/lipase
MAADDVLHRAAPPPDLVIPYGDGPGQIADVRLPGSGHAGGARPLILFLHGGFWRAAYDRAHTGPLAAALAAAGYAVCVPEFRRTGQPGGGWTGTFDDVSLAVNVLPALVREHEGPAVDSGALLLAGHSAGGHLALWAAARHRLPAGSAWRATVPAAHGVAALAAVSDLAAGHRMALGNGAVAALLGGGPADHPDRYRLTDPAQLLPVGCPLRLVHGTADDRVPCAMSAAFLARARRAGDEASFDEISGAGHFDVIDPLSTSWPRVLAAFEALTRRAA